MPLRRNLSKSPLALIIPAILFITLYLAYQIRANSDDHVQPTANVAFTQKNLSDCIKELEPKIAGWCELKVNEKTPSISSVWPKKDGRIWQTVGPQAILFAWGSAAYDEQSKTIYFMGGGGTDYGGNEVYSFALESGKWRRLTDPTPLDHFSRGKRTVWIPDTRLVPAASHLRDGLIFNPRTGTLILLTHKAAIGAPVRKKDTAPSEKNHIPGGTKPQQYEFNPSEKESRNGLAPLTWRRIGSNPWSYPRTEILPDGTLLLGSKRALYQANIDTTGQLTVGKRVLKHGDYGPVHLSYDPKRKWLWLISKGLVAYDLNGHRTQKINIPFGSPKTIAYDDQHNFVLWDGRTKIYSKNPDNPNSAWSIADWKDKRLQKGGAGRLYGKWMAIGNNYFVGLSSHRTGVWVYKHSANSPHKRDLSLSNLRKIIKQAPDGSEIKLPAGLYGYGIKIPKSLTVDMEGVELMSVYGGKAVVVIESQTGPVTIKNLRVDGKQTNATISNRAGIRVSGESFEVTIENAHITDTGIGIMTDNRGGKLTIKNSYLANIGSGKRRGLSHILYAGAIDVLRVENSILERPMRLGHVLKSRAQHTHIESTQLLGLDGRHSRVVDSSCGGKLTILNSVLQNSSNSDNSDLISVGVEQPANCKRGLLPGDVTLRGNTIVFDRGLAPGDPSQRKQLNRLFTWRSDLKALNMKDNIIVSPGGDYLFDQKIDEFTLSKFASTNRLYKSRKQASLNSIVNSNPVE